jgi:phosphoesterase RecJ-like protein
VLEFDDALLSACGATIDDTEGLVNLPLGANEVVAVALFKRQADGSCRVSLRSKPAIDVRGVAAKWGGGGHRNASGATLTGPLSDLKSKVIKELGVAIEATRTTV